MKTPKPRKLKSGSYFVQLRLGGESIPITRASARECTLAAIEAKAAYLAGRQVKSKSDMTVGQLVDAYIAARPAKTSPSTILGYKRYRKDRFAGLMEQKPQQVKDWQEVIDEELQHVTAKTVKNAWGLVAASLRYAKLTVPEIKIPQIIKKPTPFLRYNEIPPLLQTIKGRPEELAILLGLHSLRSSEIFAVRPQDIDLQHGLIRVSGAVVMGSDGWTRKDENKNESSQRNIPIMIDRVRELAEDLTGETAAGINPSYLQKHLHMDCIEAGVTDISIHGLRHSFASLCHHAGVSELQCMAWGGWADNQTMHKIYTHIAEADETDDLRRMRSLFAPQPEGETH